MYKYLYVCVYIYINLKNMSTAHRLITKPHAQGPIQELPHRKNASLFKRKNKNATLSFFSSTTPLLLFYL